VICQLWSELKRNILLIVPASLRKQWQSELSEKFFLPSEVLDGKTYKEFRKKGVKNPFEQNKIIICSYQFAAKHEHEIVKVNRHVAVLDEAHKLRNVYKNPT
jgi:SNF2 family DNA or RNA helicase